MLETIVSLVLALVFFTVPGYFLCLGFFQPNSITGMERAAYSVFFSVAFGSVLSMLEFIAFNAVITRELVLLNTVVLGLVGFAAYCLRKKHSKN